MSGYVQKRDRGEVKSGEAELNVMYSQATPRGKNVHMCDLMNSVIAVGGPLIGPKCVIGKVPRLLTQGACDQVSQCPPGQ